MLQLSILTVHLSSLHLLGFVSTFCDSGKTLVISSLIASTSCPPHPSSIKLNFIIVEDYENGQTWFQFIYPYWFLQIPFLSPICFEIIFRIFSPQSSQGLRWGWAVLPQVLILALLEDRSDIYFLSVIRDLSWSPWPCRENQEPFPNDLGQLSHHSQVYFVRSQNMCMTNSLKYTLARSPSSKSKVFLL